MDFKYISITSSTAHHFLFCKFSDGLSDLKHISNVNHHVLYNIIIYGPGDWGSIPGWVIPKTQKMVLDTPLLNIQHYKVKIKGNMEQSRE